MTRGVKVRLVAFMVLSAIGILYVSANYLGLVDKVLGRGMTVHVNLPTSGGLFVGSEVTYRGYKIGKVSDMRVTERGLQADLSLTEGTELPRSSPVYVHDLSAVGEQYLDFDPRSTRGPLLQDGDTVQAGEAAIPTDVTTVLNDLSALVGSVNRRNLPIVIGELGRMFRDNASAIRSIVDNGQAFVATADANRQATTDLIDHATTVLGTQASNRENITAFSRDLADLSGTLRGSDGDVRRILRSAPGTSAEVRALIDGLRPVTPRFLRHTVSLTGMLAAREPALEQLLVTFPRLIAAGPSALYTDPKDGQMYGRVNVNLNQNPPPCTNGYLPKSRWRSPSDTSFRHYYPAHCNSGPPINMRGMKYAPPPAGFR